MVPYSELLYFYILIILLVPAVILGIRGKSIKIYGFIINILMLIIIFGDSKKQLISLILYFICEISLIYAFYFIRKKIKYTYLIWICIILSIVPLVNVKLGDFILNGRFGFLGISYLTFKVVQILFEINDGIIKKLNLFDTLYFISFFPTISSGPIDRSRRFEKDINSKIDEDVYIALLKEGTMKLLNGAIYKFVFAAIIMDLWISKIPKEHSLLNTLNYMYGYSFYLFFDFAGYSLMAIGVSYVLGIKTPDNFNFPFISKDIKDFWNRWHMSLSFWFRDFVYTRFVMKSIKKKWFKSRYTASYIGYLITMGIMGLWHGLKIYYILYGLYHALLIVITDLYQRKSKFHNKYKNNRIYSIISIFITFNLVCFGFLMFSGYLFE